MAEAGKIHIDFDSMAREHRPFLMQIAVASTRNVDDAEDVVQEALMRAYKGLGSFRGDCPIRVWLARIVVRVSINHRRSFLRAIRRRTLFGDLERDDGEGHRIPFDAADPRHGFERETMMDVGRQVDRLPDEFRVPLLMLAVEGMTIPEISTILEIPEGTVKSRIFYGRKRLRKGLHPRTFGAARRGASRAAENRLEKELPARVAPREATPDPPGADGDADASRDRSRKDAPTGSPEAPPGG